MKVNVPFKDGYLQIDRDFHMLPSNTKKWFNDIFWRDNQIKILEKIRENPNLNFYLEIEEVLEKQGIVITVKLRGNND